ncbi:uncharacterized protein BYT42DRAFT_4626 [Radiomyces spectabilis]|uniref:uncharacterized protein n=1 Tax=Radiomyces spectabilis TaxID=64574 RepID=UPI0022204A7C|nr:uncharacterized protein BYT42DRAFT_4626 [Radiomyces spectabilis]KAI8393391.1 hypothetical protein BYT42DRAFT_4626 [Radiomyces spectabilis]
MAVFLPVTRTANMSDRDHFESCVRIPTFNGTIRISRHNYRDAFVRLDNLDAEIYVGGPHNLNRALDGDIVAVRLLDADYVWRQRTRIERQRLHTLSNHAVDNETIQKPTYCGTVVRVLDRLLNRSIVRTVSLNKPRSVEVGNGRRPKEVWFQPKDNRVPSIKIRLPCPLLEDIVHNEGKYRNILYEADIIQWGIHSYYPYGVIVDKC